MGGDPSGLRVGRRRVMGDKKGTVKKVVAAVVAVMAVGIGLAPHVLAGRRGPGGPGPAEPPWALPGIVTERVWVGGRARTSGLQSSAALVYVDRSCVHCKADLALWESLIVSGGGTSPTVGDLQVWVVASPKSVMDDVAWVPPSLRARTVHDEDGSVARALGLNAVPATFWIDDSDTVRLVHVGRTGRSRLIDNISVMRGGNGGGS